MTAPVRVPADVDREDRLIADLTARQLAILAATGAAVYALWTLGFRWLPTWSTAWAHTAPQLRVLVFSIVAGPVAVAGLTLALGRRDHMPLDRLLIAAARQRLATPTLRPQPHSPANDEQPAARLRRRRGAGRVVVPWVPARAVRAAHTNPEVGLIELGRDGLALVCAVSPISLTLRSPAEQDQLVAGMARWLHSLTAGVQILVRTTPLDLTGHVDQLRADADQLAHPALAAAAHTHADHLTDLARHTDLLHRQIYLVFHEPTPPTTHPPSEPSDSPMSVRARRAVRAAEEQLLRRAEETDHLLAAIGLRVTPLDPHTTAHALHAATHPDQHLTPPLPTPHRQGNFPPAWPSPTPGASPHHRPAPTPPEPSNRGRQAGRPRRAPSTPEPSATPTRSTRLGHRWEAGRVDPDQVTADLYDPTDLAAFDRHDHPSGLGGDQLDGHELDDSALDHQLAGHDRHALASPHPTLTVASVPPDGRGGSEEPPWSWAPGARGYVG